MNPIDALDARFETNVKGVYCVARQLKIVDRGRKKCTRSSSHQKKKREESRGIDSAIMGRRRDQVTLARRNSGPGGAGPVGVVVVRRIRSR